MQRGWQSLKPMTLAEKVNLALKGRADNLEAKSDTELIEIIMNCELDYDCRIHAAKEIYTRLGVVDDGEGS